MKVKNIVLTIIIISIIGSIVFILKNNPTSLTNTEAVSDDPFSKFEEMPLTEEQADRKIDEELKTKSKVEIEEIHQNQESLKSFFKPEDSKYLNMTMPQIKDEMMYEFVTETYNISESEYHRMKDLNFEKNDILKASAIMSKKNLSFDELIEIKNDPHKGRGWGRIIHSLGYAPLRFNMEVKVDFLKFAEKNSSIQPPPPITTPK